MPCCPCALHFISPREGWNMLPLKVMCPISVHVVTNLSPPWLFTIRPRRDDLACYGSCRGAAMMIMLLLLPGANKRAQTNTEIQKKKISLPPRQVSEQGWSQRAELSSELNETYGCQAHTSRAVHVISCPVVLSRAPSRCSGIKLS